MSPQSRRGGSRSHRSTGLDVVSNIDETKCKNYKQILAGSFFWTP